MKQKVELSRDPKDWAPVVEKVTFQWFYRQLGIVNLPMGIDVISKAVDILAKEKGMGSWHWLTEGRVLVWEDVPIDGVGKAHAYVFGGKNRQKNSVFVRQGFWKMYTMETVFSVFDRTVLGRILAGRKPLMER